MTNIPITGKITAVEVEDGEPLVNFATYADDLVPAAKTVLEPTSAPISVFNLSHVNDSNCPAGFKLSDEFELGSMVVVYYNALSPNANGVSVFDADGRTLAYIDVARVGYFFMKVLNETGNDWVSFKGV